MKLFTVVVGIALAASPALAEPLQFTTGYSTVQIVEGHPRQLTIHTVAPLQEDIKVLGRANTNERCEVSAETNYQVIEPPRHGTICFRNEKLVLKTSLGPGKCIGKEVTSRVIYYRPDGGYIGQDSYRYSTNVASRIIAINTADITITEAASPRPKEDPSQTSQAPGPMPQCPNVLM